MQHRDTVRVLLQVRHRICATHHHPATIQLERHFRRIGQLDHFIQRDHAAFLLTKLDGVIVIAEMDPGRMRLLAKLVELLGIPAPVVD